jgi:threonine dehydrogenase-like Zn-dependent dehydrogenase
MRATVIQTPWDVRLEDVPDPKVEEPTDAVVRVVASCICGSDLWAYRGENQFDPYRIGHEFVGVVEEVGAQVSSIGVGDFVIAPFLYSDNTCDNCRNGVQSACRNGGGYEGCQAEYVRVPYADGTLVATPGMPDADLLPSLLTLSDVMATGWHAARCAHVGAGSRVAVVGDGAVGLCGVLAARMMGAEQVIAMSRHADRQKIAKEFGATDVVEARGDEGVEAVRELTGGTGADSVLECVGTGPAMLQALGAARAGGSVGFVGVPHGVELPVRQMFRRNVGVRGGSAPVRNYLPELLNAVLSGEIRPGRVFDCELPLDEVAEGYAAMDERRAIKVLLRP